MKYLHNSCLRFVQNFTGVTWRVTHRWLHQTNSSNGIHIHFYVYLSIVYDTNVQLHIIHISLYKFIARIFIILFIQKLVNIISIKFRVILKWLFYHPISTNASDVKILKCVINDSFLWNFRQGKIAKYIRTSVAGKRCDSSGRLFLVIFPSCRQRNNGIPIDPDTGLFSRYVLNIRTRQTLFPSADHFS